MLWEAASGDDKLQEGCPVLVQGSALHGQLCVCVRNVSLMHPPGLQDFAAQGLSKPEVVFLWWAAFAIYGWSSQFNVVIYELLKYFSKTCYELFILGLQQLWD